MCQFLILLFREFHIFNTPSHHISHRFLSEYYILRGGVVVVGAGAGAVVINTLVVGGKVETVIKQII